MRSLHFYRLILSYNFWRTVAFIVYCILCVATAFLKDPLLAYTNLLLVSFAMGSRLNQLHNLPHGHLMPGYRQSQTFIAYVLIIIFGLFPLSLAALSLEHLLILISSGLLVISGSLFLCYLFNIGTVFFLLSVLALNIIAGLGLHFGLPYEWMTVLAFVFLTVYFFLHSRHRDIKPNLPSIWTANGIQQEALEFNLGFNLISLPMPKNPQSIYSLIYISLNPVLILAVALIAIIVLGTWFDIGQISKPTPLGGIFLVAVIASTQDVSRFNNMNELWLASHYKTKSEFLFYIGISQTIISLLPFIICMAYFFLKYNSTEVILLPLIVYGCSASFLIIAFTLARWFLLTALIATGTLFFILSTQAGLLLTLIISSIIWILSIYYYCHHSGQRSGMILPPRLLITS
ncbi:MAG: hypothetical protein ACI9FB_002540 [Candidatus Azotimanducaceae bacterium]|jgi:hypothetical protein